jgi:hypothetical protein
MAEAIGSLFVALGYDGASFNEGIKKSNQIANQNVKGINAAFTTIGKQGAELTRTLSAIHAGVAGLAGGAMIMAARNALNYASAINDASENTGLATESLQELRYAFQLGGTDAETFDKAMNKLNVTIAKSPDTLKKLGIAYKDANGNILSTEDVLKNIADKMQKTESPAQRAAIAMSTMGKSAASMVGVLSQGAAAIDETRRKAQELGIVLSDETIRKADVAGDKFETLGQIIKVKFYAGLLVAADALAKFLELLDRLEDKEAVANWNNFQEKWLGMKPDTRRPAPKAKVTYEDSDLDFGGPKGFDYAKETTDAQRHAQQLKDMVANYKDMVMASSELKNAMTIEEELARHKIDLTTKQGRAWRDAREEELRMMTVQETVKKLYEDSRDPLQEYNDQIALLNQYLKDGYIDQELYAQGVKRATENLDDANASMTDMRGAARELGSTFKDEIQDMIFASDDLMGSLRSLGQQLVSIIAKRAIFDQVGNAASGLFSAGLSSAGSWLSSFGGFRAGGGPVSPNKSYVVGENGPEMFTPNASGSITPNGMSGSVTNNYIDARGTDPAVIAQLRGILTQLAPGAIENRILNAQNRGSLR